MNDKLLDTSQLSLVDLAKRGLTAHLQTVVIDCIVDEQLSLFEARLRERLEATVRSITLGHIHQVQDFLKMTQELVVKIDVNMQEVKA
jgi:hypothetical protein